MASTNSFELPRLTISIATAERSQERTEDLGGEDRCAHPETVKERQQHGPERTRASRSWGAGVVGQAFAVRDSLGVDLMDVAVVERKSDRCVA